MTETPADLGGGLTWDQVSDGRLWRLKSGKHFSRGSMERVRQDMVMVAAELDRAVVTLRDDFGKFAYLWVQFADDEVAAGAPCPTCGGHRLLRLHRRFARCTGCGSTLILHAARTSGGGVAKRDLSRYQELRLKPVPSPAGRQRFVGYGVRFDGEPRLLEVDFFLKPDGQRLEDPARPGEYLYKMRTLTAGPFLDALDLDALAGDEFVDPLTGGLP